MRCRYKILSSESLFGITRLCRVMPNSDPKGQIFLFTPSNHDGFFFLHTFWSPAFDFNVGVTINESRWWPPYWKLTSTPNVLTTELCDLLYNYCIQNTCCYSFFIYPTGRIRVGEIRFVSTCENLGKPCRVCKKRRVSEDNLALI